MCSFFIAKFAVLSIILLRVKNAKQARSLFNEPELIWWQSISFDRIPVKNYLKKQIDIVGIATTRTLQCLQWSVCAFISCIIYLSRGMDRKRSDSTFCHTHLQSTCKSGKLMLI